MQKSGETTLPPVVIDHQKELAALEKRIARVYGISRVEDSCTIEIPRLSRLVSDSFNFHFPRNADAAAMHAKLVHVSQYLDGVAEEQNSLPNVIAFRGIAATKEGDLLVLAPLLSLLIKETNQGRYIARTSIENPVPEEYSIDLSLSQPAPNLRMKLSGSDARLVFSPSFRLCGKKQNIVMISRELRDVSPLVRLIKKAVIERGLTLDQDIKKRYLRVENQTDPFAKRSDDGSIATVGHYKDKELHRYYLISGDADALIVKPTDVLNTNLFPVSEWFDYQVRTSLKANNTNTFTWYVATERESRNSTIYTNDFKAIGAGSFRIDKPCNVPVVVVYLLTVNDIRSTSEAMLYVYVIPEGKPRTGYTVPISIPEPLKGKQSYGVKHFAGVDSFWISLEVGDALVHIYTDTTTKSGSIVYSQKPDAQENIVVVNQSDFIPAFGLQTRVDVRNKYENSIEGTEEQSLEFFV